MGLTHLEFKILIGGRNESSLSIINQRYLGIFTISEVLQTTHHSVKTVIHISPLIEYQVDILWLSCLGHLVVLLPTCYAVWLSNQYGRT